MSVENIIIRTNYQLKKMNPILVKLLEAVVGMNVEIPVIYQYLHNPDIVVEVTEENTIGMVHDIRKDEMGNIVCTIEIKDLMKLASNYQGMIDNLLVQYNGEMEDYTLNAFIIYDKLAKEFIDQKKSQVTIPGDIPFISSYGIDTMKEVSETLLEEYNKLIQN